MNLCENKLKQIGYICMQIDLSFDSPKYIKKVNFSKSKLQTLCCLISYKTAL